MQSFREIWASLSIWTLCLSIKNSTMCVIKDLGLIIQHRNRPSRQVLPPLKTPLHALEVVFHEFMCTEMTFIYGVYLAKAHVVWHDDNMASIYHHWNNKLQSRKVTYQHYNYITPFKNEMNPYRGDTLMNKKPNVGIFKFKITTLFAGIC